MMMISQLLLLLFVTVCSAQEPTQAPSETGTSSPTAIQPWGGCRDPGNQETDEVITIGKQQTVCITIGPGGNWAGGVPFIRYTFRPNVDEFSKFHIQKSYSDLVNGQEFNGGDGTTTGLEGNVTIHVAAQKKLSFLRLYYDPSKFRVYPFLTAIIEVDRGSVRQISWDDACVFCARNQCEEIMYNFDGVSTVSLPTVKSPSRGCYYQQEECNKDSALNGQVCDVTLYVVWSGTDSTGRTLQSSGNRFSMYPSSGVEDIIDRPRTASMGPAEAVQA